MSNVFCPQCGHANREGAKFCDECGSPVQAQCVACGTELRRMWAESRRYDFAERRFATDSLRIHLPAIVDE